MGWFSSKTKITVDVVTNDVVEDDLKQDFTTNAVLQGTVGDQGVAEKLLEASTGGFYTSVNQYYNRASSVNSEVDLPISRAIGGTIDDGALMDAVVQHAGELVEITNTVLSGPIPALVAYNELDTIYGFDLETGKTDRPIETDTEEDRKSEYLYIGAFFEFSFETVSRNLLVVDYQKTTEAGVTTNETLELLLPDIKPDEHYLFVEYYALADPELRKHIWLYELGTYLYPGIEYSETYKNHKYMPVVPIRKNKENLVDSLAGTQKLKDYEWMMKKLGMDLDEITDSIMSEDNGNDPNQMEEVFFLFSADLKSEEPATKKYLWKFFDELRTYQKQTKEDFETWYNGDRVGPAPSNAFEILDQEFRYALIYNYIEKETVITSGNLPGYPENSLPSEEQDLYTRIDLFAPPVETDVAGIAVDGLETSKFIMIRKIGATGFGYVAWEVITVSGLFSMHEAYREGDLDVEQTSPFNEPDGKWVKRTLADTGIEDDGFYIPIGKNFVDQLGGIDRSYLYQDCMKVTVYAVDKQKVKWYQRSIFRWVLTIVIVVVSFIFQNPQAGFTLATALQVATNVIVNIVIGEIISAALVPVIGALGLDNVAFIAAIVTVVAFVMGQTDTAATFADQLMKGAMWTMQGLGKALERAMETLADDFEEFMEELEEKYDEVEEIDKMLKGDTNINYVDLITQKAPEVFVEAPSMFYARTVHNKNPGVLSKSMISTYVARKLKLPDINELNRKVS